VRAEFGAWLEDSMTHLRSDTATPLPPPLVWCGSAAIVAHFFAVAVLVLAAPSGPWPTAQGANIAAEPQFAHELNKVVTPNYLVPLRMTHNYHFATNRPGVPAVSFEVNLKDDHGKTLQVVSFPDKNTNFWVHHRQWLLAQALADDQPIEPRGGEVIAAPHQKVQTVSIWDIASEHKLVLRDVPEHLVPRDRPVFRPSEWSLLVARSYVRYLCRVHGAASGELIRHTREPIPPAVMFGEDVPAGTFDELMSSFGEITR
jgi:hypothetical protein